MTVCPRHPMLVYYDGSKCPCCQLLREIDYLTRKKVFEGKKRKKEFSWKKYT
jgi:hypothetical protein